MIAYFDCFSGVSGDMMLGALVDAGVPLDVMADGLSRLPVGGYGLKSRKVQRSGLKAAKVDVLVGRDECSRASVPFVKGPSSKTALTNLRKWHDVREIIRGSSLKEEIKDRGLRIFKRLFEAEAHVHGSRYDRIHLHELSAVDCIIDIFGTLIGIDILGITGVSASQINLGSGTIHAEHGILPVPAPAVVELLKGIPVYSSDVHHELTTPTGAVLISCLADSFGPIPGIEITKTGTGAGGRKLPDRPNVLRIFIGSDIHESGGSESGAYPDEIVVIETNIDDMNPQIYEYVMDRLFDAGALDVYLSSIMMKKNRPGIMLSVMARMCDRDLMTKIILSETSSIGVRFHNAGRRVLPRKIKKKKTPYGTVSVKHSGSGRGAGKGRPEYDDCRKIAEKFNLPLIEVLRSLEGD